MTGTGLSQCNYTMNLMQEYSRAGDENLLEEVISLTVIQQYTRVGDEDLLEEVISLTVIQ